jgi:hypothetical protein
MPHWASHLTEIVLATTDSGSTIPLIAGGNLTNAQMSNVRITTDRSTETIEVSFNVNGQNGNESFGNITIPMSTVPYVATPNVCVNGEPALNQGYTRDGTNYYVWYTAPFSDYEVSIRFQTVPPPTPTPNIEPEPFATKLVIASAVAVATVVCVGLLVYLKKRHKLKNA